MFHVFIIRLWCRQTIHGSRLSNVFERLMYKQMKLAKVIIKKHKPQTVISKQFANCKILYHYVLYLHVCICYEIRNEILFKPSHKGPKEREGRHAND